MDPLPNCPELRYRSPMSTPPAPDRPVPSVTDPAPPRPPIPADPSIPVPDIPANQLTPEEQMARFEKELKENDWGHQPC